MDPADSRPAASRLCFPARVGFHPQGRVSQVPDRSFDTRRPQSPRQVRWLLALVASPSMSGFAHFGRLATREFVFRGRIGFAFATARIFASGGFDDRISPRFPGRCAHPRRRSVSSMSNELFTWQTPFSLLDRPGLAWRTEENEGGSRVERNELPSSGRAHSSLPLVAPDVRISRIRRTRPRISAGVHRCQRRSQVPQPQILEMQIQGPIPWRTVSPLASPA